VKIAMLGIRGVPATFGGAERAVEELSASLVERGHRVTVFARHAYSDASITQHRGIEIRHGTQINTKHLEAISHTALAAVSAVRTGDFDVVHFHATGPSLLSFAPRLVGIPTVATVQGLDYKRPKWGPVARMVLRAAARAAGAFPSETIVVSRDLERHYAQTFGVQATYVPNGVLRPTARVGPPVDELRSDNFILFLGRLVGEKHVHTLVRAYRGVRTDVPLVIAGPETHSHEYVSGLRDLAAADPRVRILGPRYGPEKDWLLSNAHTFVLPSSIEGLPIALLESLAAGRFPIVSDIAANLEPVTVGHDVLGLTVPPGDEQALQNALAQALETPVEERRRIGEKLRSETLRRYDWAAIAEQTEAVYVRAGERPGLRR